MPKIAIVDDNKDYRTSLSRLIKPYLKETTWLIEDMAPFESYEEYKRWIVEEEIAAVVLDEKLKEVTTETNVDYEGHDLVTYLRSIFPEFPIFILTAYVESEVLEETEPAVEAVLQKDSLLENLDVIIPRILRSGQRFSEAYGKDLSDMTIIAEKIVKQEASPEEIEKLNAIRKKLSLINTESLLSPQSKWIVNFEKVVDEIEGVKTEISEYIKAKDEMDKSK